MAGAPGGAAGWRCEVNHPRHEAGGLREYPVSLGLTSPSPA